MIPFQQSTGIVCAPLPAIPLANSFALLDSCQRSNRANKQPDSNAFGSVKKWQRNPNTSSTHTHTHAILKRFSLRKTSFPDSCVSVWRFCAWFLVAHWHTLPQHLTRTNEVSIFIHVPPFDTFFRIAACPTGVSSGFSPRASPNGMTYDECVFVCECVCVYVVSKGPF